jgi:uncharacterized membrane protein
MDICMAVAMVGGVAAMAMVAEVMATGTAITVVFMYTSLAPTLSVPLEY